MAMTSGIWTPDDNTVFDPPADLGAMAVSIASLVEELSPVGTVVAYAGGTAPSGWLFCHHQEISRTTYAGLFDIIGTTYGEGNGSTTFNTPNIRGRVIAGRALAEWPEFMALGQIGGERAHDLSVSEIPSHSHRLVGGNNGDVRLRSALGGLTPRRSGNWGAWFGGGYDAKDNVRTTSVGGGQPHNNLQPYITMNYIIKA